MKGKPYAISIVLITMLLCVAAWSQQIAGTLRGTVLDQTGAVVPSADVTATNQQTGVATTTKTTSAGIFVFSNVLPGMYTVTVSAPNFAKFERKDVQVLPNQPTTADARMQLASATTTVEVTAGAPVVQTNTYQLSNDFSSKAVADLPSPGLGGGPLNLALLAPNTTSQGAGVLDEGGSIGGARPRLNSFNIDGVDDNRIDVTGHTTDVIPEAVNDFQLVTNAFTAEQSHSAGGQFNVITKSGTNNWHGAAFGFNNNRNFNAMDNLEKGVGLTEPRRVDRNRAGGLIGGPIVKNKIFIFGAYQFTGIGLSSAAVAQLSPTPAGLAALTSMAASPQVRDILAQFPTAPVANGSEVVNGVAIPIGPIQPAAPNFSNDHTFNINGDVNLGKHAIRARFLWDRARTPNVNPDTPQAQFTGDIAADTRKAILTDAFSITPHVVNDIRFSYSRFVQAFTVPTPFANFPNAEIDTLGLNIGPEGNSPQSYTQNNYQALNITTIVKGNHTFKFGPEYRRYIAPSDFLPRSRGEWDYANLSELVNDVVPTGFNGALRGAGTGLFDGNQYALYGFLQDDWKVTPRLTLNLGARYEWYSNPNGVKTQTLNSISSLPGVPFLPSLQNLPTQMIFREPHTDTNNVMPRVGFAWDLFGDGRTSLRGGFGLSYDVTPQNFPLLSLPPQLQTQQDPDVTCGLPGAPPWCANFLAGGPGTGFLGGGGLLQVNVPPATAADARLATQGLILDTVEPKVATWTLSLQRELVKDTLLELRYLGTRSLELPVQARLNTLTAFDAGIAPLPTFFSASQVPAVITGGSRLSDFEAFSPTPLPEFNSTATSFPALGNSIYHSGAIDVQHRFSKGFFLRGDYTYAHNIDDATNELFSSRVNPRRPLDWRNLALDRGNSTLDVRHKFALSWVWDLPRAPIGNGFFNHVVNGWEWTGNYLVQSGQPISILTDTDANGNGDAAGDRAIFNPNGVGNTGTTTSSVVCVGAGGVTSVVPMANCASAAVAGYVADNPNARFAEAQLGAQTNVGRNTFRSPGFNIWNMGTVKAFRITENSNIQFRVSVQNIFNHRNFALAQPTVFQTGVLIGTVNNALSTTYSNVTSPLFLNQKQFTGGNRVMELGLKFEF